MTRQFRDEDNFSVTILLMDRCGHNFKRVSEKKSKISSLKNI